MTPRLSLAPLLALCASLAGCPSPAAHGPAAASPEPPAAAPSSAVPPASSAPTAATLTVFPQGSAPALPDEPPPLPRRQPTARQAPPEARARAERGALVVEMAGLTAKVRAEVVPAGNGFGVRVSAELGSADNEVHVIGGGVEPLGFGGQISSLGDESGEVGGFGEGASHGERLTIKPGPPVRTARVYPGKGAWQAIQRGQKLLLRVSFDSIASPATDEVWRGVSLCEVELVVPKKGAPSITLVRGEVRVGGGSR